MSLDKLPQTIIDIHFNNDMNINMNIDIHIIINMHSILGGGGPLPGPQGARRNRYGTAYGTSGGPI